MGGFCMAYCKRHTEPRFAETIVGVGRDGFDEDLNELISKYPDYDVTNIFSLNFNDHVVTSVPRIWATVIMEKKRNS